MSPQNVISQLKRSKHYKGQIFSSNVQGRDQIELIGSYRNDVVNEMMALLGMDGLFLHQNNTIEAMEDSKNCVLFGEARSGKSRAAYLSIVNEIAQNGKTVLLLTSHTGVADKLKELEDFLETIKWDLQIRALSAENLTMLRTNLDQLPDILITSPDLIIKYLSDNTYLQGPEFFLSCGVTVIEDLNEYRSGELVHIKYLLKMLHMFSLGEMQFIVTSAPVKSREKFAEDLLGGLRETVIVHPSHSSALMEVVYWSPPIAMDINGVLRRRNLDEELNQLIPQLLVAGKSKILIWLVSENYSLFALDEWQNSFDEFVPDSNEGKLQVSIKCVVDIADESIETDYDIIITLGYPIGFGNIENLLSNLVSETGNAIVMPDEDPISYGVFMDEEIFRFYKKKSTRKAVESREVFIAQNDYIKGLYFNLCLQLVSSTNLGIITYKLLKRTWGDSFVNNSLQQLLDKEVIRIIDPNIEIQDFDYLKSFTDTDNIRWGALEQKQVWVEQYGYLDISLIPHLAYQGSIYHRRGSSMQFNHATDGTISLEMALTKSYIGTIPIKKVEVSLAEHLSRHQTIEHTNFSIEHVCFDKFKVSTNKFYRIEADPDGSNSEDISFSPASHYESSQIQALKIKSSDTHAFYHLWIIYANKLIRNLEEFTFTYIDNDYVYISATSIERNGFVSYLFDNFLGVFEEIQQLAANIILSHPSSEPTPQCIETNRCPYCQNDSLNSASKEKLVHDLVFNRKDAEIASQIQKFKKTSPSKDVLLKQVHLWGKKIQYLFDSKLDIHINSPAKINIVSKDKLPQGVVGLYYQGINQIMLIDSCTESACAEILAHEYAHNWQFTDNNIHSSLIDQELPENGLIIIEGFAEWIAYKVCDLLGLKQQMKAIDMLSIDGGAYVNTAGDIIYIQGNEYTKGFNFIYWIEDNITGFTGLLTFIKTGEAIDPDSDKSYNISELLQMYSNKNRYVK